MPGGRPASKRARREASAPAHRFCFVCRGPRDDAPFLTCSSASCASVCHPECCLTQPWTCEDCEDAAAAAPAPAPTSKHQKSAAAAAARNTQKEHARLRSRRTLFLSAHSSLLARFHFAPPRATANPPPPRHVATDISPLISPLISNATLRSYQLDGIRYLLSRYYDTAVGAILADEMGLGKTIQTLAFLATLNHLSDAPLNPHLVITPRAVVQNWANEIKRFTPGVSFVKVAGSLSERRYALDNAPASFHVCLTTYESFLAEEPYFTEAFAWTTVTIDEGHRLKNASSKLRDMLTRLRCPFRVLLTGTPLQNNLSELHSLLSYIVPELATKESALAFTDGFQLDKHANAATIAGARALLDKLSLRRVKADVETELAPKTIATVFVPLAPMQQAWYRRLYTNEVTTSLQSVSTNRLRHLFVELQKVANHPKQLLGAIDARRRKQASVVKRAAGGDYAGMASTSDDKHHHIKPEAEQELRNLKNESLVGASNKLRLLDRLLLRLRAKGSRTLIFSKWTACLDVLQEYLEARFGRLGEAFYRLDGGTNRITRETDVRAFNAPGSKAHFYLISTTAGGVGLNLASADTVVLFDSSYNPQVDLQAMDRAHRIGQTKDVMVYRLVSALTLEERIVARQTQKALLDRAVVRAGKRKRKGAAADAAAAAAAAAPDEAVGEEEGDAGGASLKELRNMLRCGSSEIMRGEAGRELAEIEIDGLLNLAETQGGNVRLAGCLTPEDVEDDVVDDSDDDDSEDDDSEDPGDDDDSFLWWMVRVYSSAERRWHDGQLVEFDASREERPYIVAYEDGAYETLDVSHGDDGLQLVRAGEKPKAFSKTHRTKLASVRRARDECFNANRRWQMQGEQQAVPDDKAAPAKDEATPADTSNQQRQTRKGRRSAPPRKFEPVDYRKEDGPRKAKLNHEDECFHCGDGGELIMCNVCPRVYHLKCIGLKAVPKGVYRCPWHRCYECGRSGTEAGGTLLHCATCPTAYCLDCCPEAVLSSRRADLDASRKARLIRRGMQDIPSTPCAFVACPECASSGAAVQDVSKHEDLLRYQEAHEARLKREAETAARIAAARGTANATVEQQAVEAEGAEEEEEEVEEEEAYDVYDKEMQVHQQSMARAQEAQNASCRLLAAAAAGQAERSKPSGVAPPAMPEPGARHPVALGRLGSVLGRNGEGSPQQVSDQQGEEERRKAIQLLHKEESRQAVEQAERAQELAAAARRAAEARNSASLFGGMLAAALGPEFSQGAMAMAQSAEAHASRAKNMRTMAQPGAQGAPPNM